MSNIQIFNNPEFGEIRTIDQDGEPWFVGKDVALALGYADPRSAISKKVDDLDRGVAKMATPSGEQEMTIINESGLYSLCFSSKLEGAKKFKRWVTSEVLPQIRKTGSYITPKMTKEMQAIFLLDNRTAQLDQRVTALENNAVIDYGQQQTLTKAVNHRVIVDTLGGKGTPACEDAHVRGVAYCEINKDLQNWFRVNARNNIPRKRFDEAIEYVNRWKPSTNTAMMIQNVNGQTKMFA
nr:MAG TPA: repressor domain protein [Caudoviricetes sp.]